MQPSTAEDRDEEGGPLGVGANYHWWATETDVDMSMREPEPRRIRIATEPQAVIADLNRTAIVVIDMQNDFCAKDGWVDHLGVDYSPDRAPIEPLQKLLPVLRSAKVPVIWVNWSDFEAKTRDGVLAANALSDVQTLEDLQAGLAALSQTCKSCHTLYRE